MSFGTSDMSIGISLFLRDQFSGTAQGVRNSMRQMSNEAKRMQEQQLRMQRNLNATGAAIGIGVMNQMAKWIKTGSEFGYTMQYVSSIADQQGVSYDKLSEKAKQLGQNTMFTANDVASGMRFMAMAGQNTEQIYNNITSAVNLAGSTMTALGGKGGAADILTNVMKGFDIESTLENSTRAADILTTATTSANVSLFDLGESLKYSTSTAKDLNLSLEETAAMVMAAGDAGIQGSMAGTAIENMLRYVVQAAGVFGTKKQALALDMIGLSGKDLKDAQGNLLPISQLLHKISAATQQAEIGGADMSAVYSKIFGVRGKREASLLLRNLGNFDEAIAKLVSRSTGSSAKVMSDMMGTLEGNILQMTSAWDVAKTGFTEALQPVLIPLLKVLTTILKGITAMMSTKFGKFLTIVAAGFITIRTAGMAYRAVQAGIRLMNLQMGSTFATTANTTVSGYNRMAAAAMNYGGAAGAANAMAGIGGRMGAGLFGMGARKGVFKTAKGGFYTTATATGAAKFISKSEANRMMYGRIGGWLANSKLGRATGGLGGKLGGMSMGGMFKGGGLGIGLAGMGVEALGGAIGGTTGKTIGVAGSALSGAGTGAMIGSIIPGIGTAIGGIVGGLWGLGSSIYDWVTASEDNTEALEDNNSIQQKISTTAAAIAQNPASFWGKQLSTINAQEQLSNQVTMAAGQTGWEDIEQNRYRMPGGDFYMGNLTQTGNNPTQIIFNVDGEQKMNDIFENNMRTQNYELGL